MEQYLSHFSAAVHWDIHNLNDIFGADKIDKYRNNQVVDLTAFKPDKRPQKDGIIAHSCTVPLPQGAIIKTEKKLVASPELTFLELADQVDIQTLILPGLQLCSCRPGEPSESVTTKRKLNIFLEKTKGHRGHKKASRALKYIENGAASIMESLVFMILTLPNLYGGYGLSGASINSEIMLGEENCRQLKQVRCYADLFYSEAKLAVEYDSFKYHSKPVEQGKDLMRATALEHQGIEVLRLGTTQLYDENACRVFAQNLAKRLGTRIRIRSHDFYKNHRNIREFLP